MFQCIYFSSGHFVTSVKFVIMQLNSNVKSLMSIQTETMPFTPRVFWRPFWKRYAAVCSGPVRDNHLISHLYSLRWWKWRLDDPRNVLGGGRVGVHKKDRHTSLDDSVHGVFDNGLSTVVGSVAGDEGVWVWRNCCGSATQARHGNTRTVHRFIAVRVVPLRFVNTRSSCNYCGQSQVGPHMLTNKQDIAKGTHRHNPNRVTKSTVSIQEVIPTHFTPLLIHYWFWQWHQKQTFYS